jgi:acetyl-CoA carboxylase biotin carboxylase subunit
MKLFNKILIANRGEIAVRIIKTAKKLGIRTVAIYSEIDVNSHHVSIADEAYCIGKSELSDTYLNIEKIIAVARKSNSEAVHPGYGFLSENATFAKECTKSGIAFIGPSPETIKLMGNKIEARNFIQSIGIPMLSGTSGNPATLLSEIENLSFPLLVKAAAGGGGKGMKIVRTKDELQFALESASREAKNYFGDGSIFVEKFIETPRHIEIQIIGDNFGNVIHLLERECTIQRRYQKIIEECPSATLTEEVRQKMCNSAVEIGKKIGYNNAGTIEFLVDENLNYYFLEMNTRIQVEHPVTEMVTKVDIVAEQIYIAAGNPLRISQKDIAINGHSIECRIYAENPFNNFMPSPGEMTLYSPPKFEDIRLDSAIVNKTTVSSSFDPMIAKIIVHGNNRNEAIHKMSYALKSYKIHGISNNISYLIKILENEDFIENNISTKFCDKVTNEITGIIKKEKNNIPEFIPAISYLIYCFRKDYLYKNAWQEIKHWRNQVNLTVIVDNKKVAIELIKQNNNYYEFIIDNLNYKVSFLSFVNHELDIFINDRFYKSYISEDKKGKTNFSYDIFDYEISREDYLLEQEFNSDYDSKLSSNVNFVSSPMPGKIIKINIAQGDKVKKGSVLLVVEAMKMENYILSPKDTVIKEIKTKIGEMVESQNQLIVFEE